MFCSMKNSGFLFRWGRCLARLSPLNTDSVPPPKPEFVCDQWFLQRRRSSAVRFEKLVFVEQLDDENLFVCKEDLIQAIRTDQTMHPVKFLYTSCLHCFVWKVVADNLVAAQFQLLFHNIAYTLSVNANFFYHFANDYFRTATNLAK